MQLRNLGPYLVDKFENVDHIIRELNKAGVKTIVDLLFANTPQSIFNKIPEGLITYGSFLSLVDSITSLHSAAVINGSEAYEKEIKLDDARFGGETGVKELDQLLSGSLGIYGVVELSGAVSTIVALTVLLRHLSLRSDHSSWWIEFNSGFLVDKAASILENMEGPGKDSALNRLRVLPCENTIEKASAALHSLHTHLHQLPVYDSEPCQTRYVVVDSMNSLFNPLLLAGTSQGHSDLMIFMRQLATLAQTYQLTVIVINNTVVSMPRNPLSAFTSAATKPGLGPTFTYSTDWTILFNSAERVFGEQDETLANLRKREMTEITVYVAEILRTRHSVSSDWCPFVVRDDIFLESLVL